MPFGIMHIIGADHPGYKLERNSIKGTIQYTPENILPISSGEAFLPNSTLYAATRTEMGPFKLADKRELTASKPDRVNAMRMNLFFIIKFSLILSVINAFKI